MRLTLRTLLAYLDKTLEPQDAATLEAKIGSSQFAAQLVARIGAVLGNSRLAAPDPDAAGPTEDANVIGEYLDSTLPAEQIADVERACLESDVQLAEAAACHQVLTMVLGTRAEVPQSLRQRIYGLAGQQTASEVGRESVVASSDASAVTPVGLADSGAYRATSRMDAEAAAASNGHPRPTPRSARAARRIGAAEASEIFGGNIRSSRVVPWLVSLALCAAFLFVLAQAFAPLLERKRDSVAQPDAVVAPVPLSEAPADAPVEDETAADGQRQAEPPPPADPTARPAPAEAAAPPTAGDAEGTDGPLAAPDPIPAADAPSASAPTTATDDPLASDTGRGSEPASPADPLDPVASESLDWLAGLAAEMSESLTDSAAAGSGSTEVVEVPAGDAAGDSDATGSMNRVAANPVAEGPGASASEVSVTEDRSPGGTAQPAPAAADAVPAATGASPGQVGLARLVSDDALLLAYSPATRMWVRVTKDHPLHSGTRLVFPAGGRTMLILDERMELTLVGPSDVVLQEVDGQPQLQIRRGRLLLAAVEDVQTQLPLRIFDSPATVGLTGQESVAAISATHFRPPGANPLDPASTVPVLTVLSVQGEVDWESTGSDPVTLETGQRWSRVGEATPEIALPPEVPAWIDPQAADLVTLEETARRGLLELLPTDQPVELALREAIHFRRAEVGSLAARALLIMGHPEVYFGSDGVLSMPQQKTYWPEHVLALQEHLDQGPEQANQIRRAATQMDAASADALFRLLWGFSPTQLGAGADATLVETLDSPQMALRVLASETLRQITGTSLYFKPEQEVAARRKSDITKWETRARRGDIRWKALPTALPAAEPEQQ